MEEVERSHPLGGKINIYFAYAGTVESLLRISNWLGQNTRAIQNSKMRMTWISIQCLSLSCIWIELQTGFNSKWNFILVSSPFLCDMMALISQNALTRSLKKTFLALTFHGQSWTFPVPKNVKDPDSQIFKFSNEMQSESSSVVYLSESAYINYARDTTVMILTTSHT